MAIGTLMRLKYGIQRNCANNLNVALILRSLALRGGGSKKRRRDQHPNGEDGQIINGAASSGPAKKNTPSKIKVTKIMEKDGLEWRRNEDDADAEKIVQQADEGRFDEDLLEVRFSKRS
jgi:hypothetical protein